MVKCSAEVINEFNVGLFSTELSASKFNSASIDYVLEAAQIKALKGSKDKYWTDTNGNALVASEFKMSGQLERALSTALYTEKNTNNESNNKQ